MDVIDLIQDLKKRREYFLEKKKIVSSYLMDDLDLLLTAYTFAIDIGIEMLEKQAQKEAEGVEALKEKG